VSQQWCERGIYSARSVRHTCRNKGVLYEEAAWWCRVHAPSSFAARREARDKRWEKMWARKERGWAIEKLNGQIVEAAKAWRKQGGNAGGQAFDKMIKLVEKLLRLEGEA